MNYCIIHNNEVRHHLFLVSAAYKINKEQCELLRLVTYTVNIIFEGTTYCKGHVPEFQNFEGNGILTRRQITGTIYSVICTLYSVQNLQNGNLLMQIVFRQQ